MQEKSKKPLRVGEIILVIVVQTIVTSAIIDYYSVKENLVNFLIFFVLLPFVSTMIYVRIRYPGKG